MRVFIAVDLPKEVKDELFKIAKNFNSKNSKISWIAKKNLHLTLKFIGEITEDELNKIIQRCSNLKFKPIDVSLNKVNFFMHNGTIKVVYIDLNPSSEVIKLQQIIDAELLDLFSKDQKFHPHLTLGRIKQIKNNKEFSEEIKKIKVKNLSFNINNFSIFVSKLTKDGPQYTIVKTFNE